MNNNANIEGSQFLVDEEPYCVWEWDLKKRNLAFINALTPGYFGFMAETIMGRWGGDDDRKAALAIRTLYGHALEAFFALVGATVQAPDCVPGWMLKYRQNDLVSISKKMTRGCGLATKLKLSPLNWHSFSEAVLSFVQFETEEKRQRIIAGFSTAWARFASDVANERLYVEYNNIKHGFRVASGGFSMSFGEEHTYGVPPPVEEMRSLGGSKHGTSFLVPEKLGGSKNHFRLRSVHRNWIPENYFYKVQLIGMSMSNILSFLKAVHEMDRKTLKFSWPADDDGFEKPWAGSVGVTDCDMNLTLDATDVQIFTDDEIRSAYKGAIK